MWQLSIHNYISKKVHLISYYNTDKEASVNAISSRVGNWAGDGERIHWTTGFRVSQGIFTNIMLF